MPAPDVSLVVVNWNTRELLRECLLSLGRCATGTQNEVLVVDNASRDGSAELVRREFPGVRLIANERNLGFAAACNQGLSQSQGRYVLLLNADTRLEEDVPAALAALLDREAQAALAGCLQVSPEGRALPSAAHLPTLRGALAAALGLRRGAPAAAKDFVPPFLSFAQHQRAQAVDILVGACLLVRRAAFERTGGLDEGLFLFAEEWEWCLRLRRAGWQVLYTPQTRIVHHVAASWSLSEAARERAILSSQDHVYRRLFGPTRAAAFRAITGWGAALRVGLFGTALGVATLSGSARRAHFAARLAVHRARWRWSVTASERRLLAARDMEAPPAGRRLALIDPIGHVLGSHDQALAAALVAQGWSVTLFTSADPASFAGPGGAGHAGAGQAGFAVEALHPLAAGQAWVWLRGLAYARALRALTRCLRERGIQDVVLYYPLFPPLERRLLQRLHQAGCRSVLCLHDVLPLVGRGGRPHQQRALCLAADRVLVFSECAQRELVQELAVPREQVSAVSLGCDHLPEALPGSRDTARAALAVADDALLVLCLGQIKPNKDLGTLLEAVAQVRAALPKTALRIVGQPLRVNLAPWRARARELGLPADEVFRPRRQSEAELLQWLAAADVLVLPYTRLYQSAILLQAAALGVPIVANRVGHVPEVLCDGETAWLVEPGHVPALAAALQAALSDPAEAQRRADAARRALRASCTWAKVAQTLDTLLTGTEPQEAR
ncbi:MAG: glycosyltransferase [Planctomycetota bacterium]